MRRRFGRGSVLLGLVLLHGLADVAVGLYRTHDINRELTDLLAGALSRSQICLLALWLAAGFERLSWRICGLLGGSSFVFVVFSRTVFPGQTDIKTGNPWLEQEWEYYFRSSGPGDFLVRLPILIVDVAGPLLVWRAWRAIRLVRAGSRAIQFGWEWLQFRLHDAAVWTTTICVVAVAIFQTTPYPEWFSELQKRWVQYYQFQDRAALYHLLSSADYVLVALASLGVPHLDWSTGCASRIPVSGRNPRRRPW